MSTSTTHHDSSRQNSLTDNQQRETAALLLDAAAQESSEESGDELAGRSPSGISKSEKRKKRSRACQACRNMKIRCNPVEGQEACLACSKVNRQCVMPGPARKRQKTVHKVAELEKKINALTQSLLVKAQGHPTPQQSPVVTDGSRSAKEQTKDSPEERSTFPLFQKHEALMPLAQLKPVDSDYEDVVDRRIISLGVAGRIFDKFISEMNPLCPLVAFPPDTTFESIRHTRPFLSLAILAAGSVSVVPELHAELTEELAKQLADRIFFVFERSLDLIQAALLLTTWVGKHKNAKDIGFNQYIHSAIVMAHDLGLSRQLKTPLTKDPSEEAEMRRTWLACYYSGMCVATILRHPPMVRNSSYTQECMVFFAKSPAALPSDKNLCTLAKVVAIMEDVAIRFHMDDPSSTIRIEDASTQYSLRLFEKRLEEWCAEARPHFNPGLLDLVNAAAALYIHEIALHTDHNIDDFRPPAGRPGASDDVGSMKDTITPSHVDALAKCVVAMKGTLDTFIAIFPSPTMHHLPCLSIVWTAYAAVAMIRLDGALRASKSKYADLFLPDLKVDYYLDAIIGRLQDGTRPGTPFAPGNMFAQAFQKLKLWHQYRLTGGVPAEFADMADPKDGMHNVHIKLSNMMDNDNKTVPASYEPAEAAQTISGVENGMIASGAYVSQKVHQAKSQRLAEHQLQQQQGLNAASTGNMQGFNTHGGSWLTNSNVPIDASMFENQDWNFTLEDWNSFEASMVQPAGGTWLGYLL